MIKNIKINNLGVFQNFKDEDINFKKFNLFFGWNYSGKTTLSKIFASFDNKKLPQNYSNVNFELIGENGNYGVNDLNKLKTKVFNQDYIDNNLSFEEQSTTNIILLTEGADDIKKQLKRLENECAKISKLITNYQSIYKKNQERISITHTDIARNIAEKLNLGRKFNAKDVRDLINEIDMLTLEYNILEEDILYNDLKTYNSQADKKIEKNIPNIIIPELDKINEILNKTISITESINRLRTADEEEWVRQGLSLHKNSQVCLYCGSILTNEIKQSLDNHFSDIYKQFGQEIESLKKYCNKINLNDLPKSNEFFPKFIDEYQNLIDSLNVDEYNQKIDIIINSIEKKLKERIHKIEAIPNYNFETTKSALIKIERLINTNNEFNNNFLKEKQNISERIILHYISDMLLDKNYQLCKKEVDNANRATSILTQKLRNKYTKIEELNKKISDAAEGAEKINTILRQLFLNNTEIEIKIEQTQDNNEITRLYRNNELATNLSEGEKTAIAFAHFLASLEDKDNIMNKENTIIYIDDPVSSLDSNHIFSVYAQIDKIIQDNYCQIFLSTHNYDFYRLFIDAHKEPKPNCYYIKRFQESSKIIEIPNCYKNFRTEYNHLYYSLKSFVINNNEEENLIEIGNKLRKFLEIFTANKSPTKDGVNSRVAKLGKEYCVDNVILTTVLKVANTSSHSQIEQFFIDPNSMKSAIKETFKFVNIVDSYHLSCLEESYNNTGR